MSAEKSKIEQFAYRIWEDEGRPEGRDLDHWIQAEALVKAAKPAKAPARPKAVKPKTEKAKAAAKPKAAPKGTKASAVAAKA